MLLVASAVLTARGAGLCGGRLRAIIAYWLAMARRSNACFGIYQMVDGQVWHSRECG